MVVGLGHFKLGRQPLSASVGRQGEEFKMELAALKFKKSAKYDKGEHMLFSIYLENSGGISASVFFFFAEKDALACAPPTPHFFFLFLQINLPRSFQMTNQIG